MRGIHSASTAFLVFLLISAIPSDLAATVRATTKQSYPTEAELLPIRAALLRMREATVYRVDERIFLDGRDSTGIVAGYRILASALASQGDWLDSLASILAKQTSYLREERLCMALPEYVIRLRGDDDSMTVTTGEDCSFLDVKLSSGPGLGGWLDEGREKLAHLIDLPWRPEAQTASASKPRLERVLLDPGLFQRLDKEKDVEAFRLEGEWGPGCDSLVRDGGSALDCFVRTATLHIRSRKAIPKLLGMLATCTWIRSRGWTSPASPSLGFRIGGDSLDVNFLISLRAMKVMLSRAGEGCIAADIPESLYQDVSWCLWAVDSDNPEVASALGTQMRRRGLSPGSAPPLIAEYLGDVVPDRTSELDTNYYDEPPMLVSQIKPVYPEMAKEAQIEGRVVLRVFVGADGRVKDVRVIKSVTYLDGAAVAAVRKWVYKPARTAGEPVAAWVDVTLDFPD